MNTDQDARFDTLLDLLIARSLHGLTDEEQAQLDLLLADLDETTLRRLQDDLEAALATAGNASALRGSADHTSGDAPPPGLYQRLEEDADRFFGLAPSSVADLGARRAGDGRAAAVPDTAHAAGARRMALAGWLGWAAAAMLLVVVWSGRPAPGPALPTSLPPAEARAALLAEADTVTLPWAPSAWSEFEAVQGDVSWNDGRQEGYLRLVDMPPNDPSEAQYQLWIVDPERDSEPVDGGVFDVPAGTGELIVPVRATLPVDRPVAFAITRERPGGVVVSEGPLLVVASRG